MSKRKDSINEEAEEIQEESPIIEKSKIVEFVALKTTKVFCNKNYDLKEGVKIPADFPKSFVKSLINSKIIKEV